MQAVIVAFVLEGDPKVVSLLTNSLEFILSHPILLEDRSEPCLQFLDPLDSMGLTLSGLLGVDAGRVGVTVTCGDYDQGS